MVSFDTSNCMLRDVDMSDKFLKIGDRLYNEQPHFVLFPLGNLEVSDECYVNMFLDVARQCGIRCDITETDEKYRFDMYLYKNVAIGVQSSEWTRLIDACDMYFMDINEKAPKTIRVSFYRTKRK